MGSFKSNLTFHLQPLYLQTDVPLEFKRNHNSSLNVSFNPSSKEMGT